MEREWEWFSVNFKDTLYGNFWFLPIFQSVLRQHAIYPKENVIINVPNHKYQYKFVFDWQGEDICGVEVYRNLK